ncbi:MAG: esterase-like activity of phytase family protein [Hydrogenophilus sp.]|nr:esterase-like activity of phytase family protein [Hydrogenophilus sp.]
MSVAFTLQLLHFSDAEAGLLAPTTAPYLAALVDRLEDLHPNTLTIAGGDNYIPGPFAAAALTPSTLAAIARVQPQQLTPSPGAVLPPFAADIAIHNAIGVQASALGNHEFDWGSSVLRDAFAGSGNWRGATWPYLTANLDFSNDVALRPLYIDTISLPGLERASTLAGKIVPNAIIDIGADRVGLVGLTTPLLPRISSPTGTLPKPMTDPNRMDELAAILQSAVDDLLRQGINKIILLSHLQLIDLEIQLARRLKGVDIIVAAGSHTRMGDADDRPVEFPGHPPQFQRPYPILERDAEQNPTLIVSTDNEYTYLGRLLVDFDVSGRILTDTLSARIAQQGAIAATPQNVALYWGIPLDRVDQVAFAEGTRGWAVRQITTAVQNELAAKTAQIAGYTAVYLEGDRAQVRAQETNLGNLTADANLWLARNALLNAAGTPPVLLFSLKNGGGIRAPIGEIATNYATGTTQKSPPGNGAITQLDIENVLRFNNRLILLELTLDELKQTLEHGVAQGTGQGRFPQVGGLRFSWDPNAPAGNRIRDIAIERSDGVWINLYDDGRPLLSPSTPVGVVTLDFLANGGDGYPLKNFADSIRLIVSTQTGQPTLTPPIPPVLDLTRVTPADLNLPHLTPISEQKALFDYLRAAHPTPSKAYAQPETSVDQDLRIQNLQHRPEAVLAAGKLTIVSALPLPAAEILAYDPESRKLYTVGGTNLLYLVDLADPAQPRLLNTIPLAGPANSVALSPAARLLAVAVEQHETPLPNVVAQTNGKVQLYRIAADGQLHHLADFTVGVQPDSIAISPDGRLIVTANEGEPNQYIGSPFPSNARDPLGSVSIIDVNLSDPARSTVTTLSLDAFNGQEIALQARGWRISADDRWDGILGNRFAQDAEPESVIIHGDRAYVTLQENNGILVLDLAAKKIIAHWGLGAQWSLKAAPQLLRALPFELPYPGTRPDPDGDGQIDPGEVIAGGLSGLFWAGEISIGGRSRPTYWAITDRGPQAAAVGDRPGDRPDDPHRGKKIFDDPAFTPAVHRLALTDDQVLRLETIYLRVPDGSGNYRYATGLPAVLRNDDAVALTGRTPQGHNQYAPTGRDPFGLDPEAIVSLTHPTLNGGRPLFLIADEYGPQIALFDAATGQLLRRYVPQGFQAELAQARSTHIYPDSPSMTLETLPAVYLQIANNRGFEALAYDSDRGLLYAFVQSPLRGAKNQEITRILAIDPATGQPQHEYLLPLHRPPAQDKIGDAVYDPTTKRLYYIERDSTAAPDAHQEIYAIDLRLATDTLDYTLGRHGKSWSQLLGLARPEDYAGSNLIDLLAQRGVTVAQPQLLLHLASLPGLGGQFDKPEGLALRPDGTLAVIYDNDFTAVANRPANLIAEIVFRPLALDTSDEDGGIRPGTRDLWQLRMPDGIVALNQGGQTYLIVANEGDSRLRPDPAIAPMPTGASEGAWYSDEPRLTQFTASTLPAAPVPGLSTDAALARNGPLGRLKVIRDLSDPNGDGRLDQIVSFGARSIAILDTAGHILYDSGDLLDRAAILRGLYDDRRSDDKGVEPENLALAMVGGTPYLYVGLERANALALFDLSQPTAPRLIDLISLAPTGLSSPEGVIAANGWVAVATETIPGIILLKHGTAPYDLFL